MVKKFCLCLVIIILAVCSLFTYLQAKEAIQQDKYCVNLLPFLNLSVKEAIMDVGCLPIICPISKKQLEEIYSIFIKSENFNKICEISKSWGEQFALTEEGALWTNYRFGILDSNGP